MSFFGVEKMVFRGFFFQAKKMPITVIDAEDLSLETTCIFNRTSIHTLLILASE